MRPKNQQKPTRLIDWFKQNGWSPFPFQLEAWKNTLRGVSTFLQVPTGHGKTLAAFGGPLLKAMEATPLAPYTLYISPLKAVTRDISLSLEATLKELDLSLRVETRTGDDSFYKKKKQFVKPPHFLFTTPESISLFLSFEGANEILKSTQYVIVDEWHDLAKSKRGVQVELVLAHLKRLNPGLTIIGLSATLSNPLAADHLFGTTPYEMISTNRISNLDISVISHSGHSLELTSQATKPLLSQVMDKISRAKTSIFFTNTRAQAEKWYQELSEFGYFEEKELRLHHSSLPKKEREEIEQQLKTGEVKCVIATSSLDLGVDFSPVDLVLQLGSPKSFSRLLQRAGRSNHNPFASPKITLIPTHVWDLAEFEAIKEQVQNSLSIEPVIPYNKCFDVLSQHMVTLACGDGFKKGELWEEARSTTAYRNLRKKEFDQILEYNISGGYSLQAYPEFKKLVFSQKKYVIASSTLAKIHRQTIGTIPRESLMRVVLKNQKTIGYLDETFISQLKKGDQFVFAGRRLEFLFLREDKAYMSLAKHKTSRLPSWPGGRVPISELLGAKLRESIARQQSSESDPELQKWLHYQKSVSYVPKNEEVLFETLTDRTGSHLFVYLFEGVKVNHGIANLWSMLFSQEVKQTLTVSANDWGIQLSSNDRHFDFKKHFTQKFLDPSQLSLYFSEGINWTELTAREFRKVAEIAGLVVKGPPHKQKGFRQIQASGSIFFNVLKKYEPEHFLLKQATQDALRVELEKDRLEQCLLRLQHSRLIWRPLEKISPFSFTLYANRLSNQLSNETLSERLQKMRNQWVELS